MQWYKCVVTLTSHHTIEIWSEKFACLSHFVSIWTTLTQIWHPCPIVTFALWCVSGVCKDYTGAERSDLEEWSSAAGACDRVVCHVEPSGNYTVTHRSVLHTYTQVINGNTNTLRYIGQAPVSDILMKENSVILTLVFGQTDAMPQISTYINTKMFVCLSVCSRYSRPFGIRLGYYLAQSFVLVPWVF